MKSFRIRKLSANDFSFISFFSSSEHNNMYIVRSCSIENRNPGNMNHHSFYVDRGFFSWLSTFYSLSSSHF